MKNSAVRIEPKAELEPARLAAEDIEFNRNDEITIAYRIFTPGSITKTDAEWVHDR